MTLTSRSSEQTHRLGEAIGRRLDRGDVLTLSGELGAGKTVFAQGVGAGLDVDDPVSSPTFALVHEYAGRLPYWHLDVYRLGGTDDLIDLSWQELLSGGGVVLVEWPERIQEALPEQRLEVRLAYGDGDTRTITLIPHGERMGALVKELAAV